MKTTEEAKKYAKKIIVLENRDSFSNEANLRTAEYWAYKAYLAGYNEAYNQALDDRDNFAIEFAKWVESLSPSDRVTLWSKNGSISGMFNMDMEQLLCKYKSKTKTSN